MDLKNKVMILYEDILEPVKARKIVLLLKYVIIDGETDINKLQREIPLREVTLRSYINDDSLMLNYLTPEELKYFRDKMSKILTKTKLERLIELVLEKNETDIFKIKNLVPIRIETIKKYMQDKEKLSIYLPEEKIVLFLSKLESIMQQVNPKLQRLIKCVLEDGETNLNNIEKKANIKIDTIRKHVQDPKELKRYLQDEELNLFLAKVKKMLNDKDNELYNEELNLVKRIIDDIFHTRYRFEDVCGRNFMPRDRFEYFLDNEEYMNKNFPSGTAKLVRDRITQNGLIRSKQKKDYFLVEDRINIYYAKEDVFFLNQFDNKRLNFAAYYLASGANLELLTKKFETNMQVALGILSDPKLEQILKPEYYEILKELIKIEKLLIENDLVEKKKFVYMIMENLGQNNFDKQLTMQYYKIPEILFNKILVEIIRLPYASDGIKEELKKVLGLEEEKKIK